MTEVRKRTKYITRLDQVAQLGASEQAELAPVVDRYAFRLNEYYNDLIDWDDPADPIRQLVIPNTEELKVFGEWDASDEASYTVAPGLEHKYGDTALLLVNNVCGAYCRFCFRKRLFTEENDEVVNDVSEGLEYIRNHPEISNVLLTGGDPLILSTRRLGKIFEQLRAIPHVEIIRVGSKMPAFDPYRILGDPSLLETFEEHSSTGGKIFLMAHFNHPRELTDVALEGMERVQKAGVTTVNQTPLIRGVNDDPEVIAELFQRLASAGILPYYLFICRPTAGNDPFVVPVERSLEIYQEARRKLSGLARQARLCMSHKTGKIEVVGMTEGPNGRQVILRYHRSPGVDRIGELMFFDSDPEACWFDDYLG